MLFIEAKWLYNDILSYSQVQGNLIQNYKLQRDIKIKDKYGNFIEKHLSHISSQIMQSVYANIKASIKGLYQLKKSGIKVGKLKYKSSIKSVELPQYKNTYRIYNHSKVNIQNIFGLVHVNGLKQIKDAVEFANARLLNRPDGYYLAVTTYTNKNLITTKPKADIGIDMGCQTSFTLSNGDTINVLIKEPERLKKLQRKLERQKKGSNNRKQTIHKIQKIYRKLLNIRNDKANKIVANLNSRFGLIYIQDENLKGWHKNGHGKAVQHSCLGRVKDKLKKQSNVFVVNKWNPTTQQCLCCGKKHPMTQNERTFKCPHCGLTMPRDLHSANRMVQEGRKLVPPGQREYMSTDLASVITSIFRGNTMPGSKFKVA